LKTLRGARVLVTGATGFIGSRLAARLHAAGAEVHILARASSGGRKLGALWDALPRHTADLGDAASLAAAAQACDPEVVFHLAKEREGAAFPKEAAATLRLAAALAARAPRLRRWVRTAHAVREDTGRGADAELCRAMAARFALPVVTLELFQVYGPGQDLKDFAQLQEGRGGAKDLVFVDDVVDAYERAALAPGVEGLRFEIGSGAVSGTGPGHPADIRAAKERLGWAPRTRLADGWAKTIEWLGEGRGAAVD
jgi:nucleoside-diphosphate-sugar epimerase